MNNKTPTKDKNKLPYRKNVACVLFQGERYLLVQSLGWPRDFWKFPQGGVKKEESREDTLKRELNEELGIVDYKIVGVSKYINKYDWAEESVKIAGFRWRGQIQKFMVVEYLGDSNKVKANTSEIQDCKWVNIDDLFSNIDHDHKDFTNYKNIIEKILREFNKLPD